MRKVMLPFILFFSLFGAEEKPYILLVSFDGFRYDYIDWTETPNFDYVEKNGVKADGLIPVFPSLTFPNHYAIATGAYAGTHNITGNSFYDKNLHQNYSLYDSHAIRDPRFYKSEPIWVTAERQGIKTASFFWVGTEAPIRGISPSIFKYYDGDIAFDTRVDSVVSWLQLKEHQRPHLILLYFSEPDHTGHEDGVDKDKMIESVTKMDNLLGYLLQQLKRLDIYSQINIVITSDHGMTDVSADRLLILDDYISRMDDLYINGRGAHIQLEHKKGKSDYADVLYRELKNIPHSQTWEKSGIPERFHFVNNNTGDYLLLADEGWFITTNSALKESEFTLGGMHGYDPALPNMHGIFYAMGPELKSGIHIPSFENIHIYPLLCELLGINPYSGKDDAPDGDIRVLQHILFNQR